MPAGRDYFQCPVVVVAKMANEDMRGPTIAIVRMRGSRGAHDQLLVTTALRMLLHLINCSHQVAHARLQLRPWSSSFLHGDVHRFHLNHFKSIQVLVWLLLFFGTLCGMQISMCKMHHVHHLKLLQTLRSI